MPKLYDDTPIKCPSCDLLKHNIFAESIAKCIDGIQNPNGQVVAVHGAWGAGKSSVIELVRYHLEYGEFRDRQIIIPFESWNYRTEDGVVSGFFREFYCGLEPEADRHLVSIDSLRKLGTFVSGTSDLIGAGLNLMLPGAGTAISAVSKIGEMATSSRNVLENFSKNPQGADELRNEVCSSLEKIDKKILVIIDDIDRLSPEEAIAIFRIIKSVGKLTNVVYLISYDRKETENMLRNKYKFDGSHYLEKIVQASFDVPTASKPMLINLLSDELVSIFKDEISYNERFSDSVDLAVIPEISTLRGMYRLINMISVTYESVRDDVDIADFVAIEALRLFRPNIHQKILDRKDLLTYSTEYLASRYHKNFDGTIEDVFINEESKSEHSRLKDLLYFLFPPMHSISTNFDPAADDMHGWEQERRICSANHFDTYFRFSVSTEAISQEEFQDFVENAADSEIIEGKLRHYLEIEASDGRTKASYLLDRIVKSGDVIAKEHVEKFLESLYSVSAYFRVDSDSIKYLGSEVDNMDRIFKVSEKVLLHRLRNTEIVDALTSLNAKAPPDVFLKLCDKVLEYIKSGSGGSSYAPDFDESTNIQTIQNIALNSLQEAVRDNSIVKYNKFVNIFSYAVTVCEDRNLIMSIFSDVLGRSDENVLFVFREFYKRFKFDDVRSGYNMVNLRNIGGYCDIDNFVTRLMYVHDNYDFDNDEQTNVNQLINLIKEILKN